MKKTLSIVLAFAMTLSVLSGLVIFSATAEKPFYADYEFTQLPGIQDWGETEITTYNTQANKKASDSGTPGELVTTHTKGEATQAIKLITNGSPNAWTIAFSTCGNVDDRTAASQIGGVLGDYSNMSVLRQYSGMRIAVVNESGNEPSFNTWDKDNSHIFGFRFVSTNSNSWGNKSYPWATYRSYYKCKEDPAKENTLVYADGYYYVYFKDLMDGWNSGKPFFEKYPTNNNDYGNLYFWIQTGGINNLNYNGGAIYVSDMQLFKEPEPMDFDGLQKLIDEVDAVDAEGKYAEALAAARAVIANPDVSRAEYKAAKEALEAVTDDLIETVNALLDDADMYGFFDETSQYYDLATDCDMLVNTPDHTLKEYAQAILALRTAMADGEMGDDLFALVSRANNLWYYNYTENSYYAARKTAMSVLSQYDDNDEELLPVMQAAIDALKRVKTYQTGEGTLFDDWTATDVNDLVDINANKLCDDIGTGLNTKDVWNNGDFTNDTTYDAGDGWFSMTAEDDFRGASIGWKNMDRDGTLAGSKNAGFPVFGDVDFVNADGIRFKMEVSEGGHVGRVLIGLSNCKDGSLEGYALKLPTAGVDEDGYMVVPFSYFEKAWWTSADIYENRAKFIVFIVEAYDVTEGTELKLSDMTTFTYNKPFVAATQLQLDMLRGMIDTLEETDLGDGHLDKLIETAQEAIDSGDGEICQEAIDELTDTVQGYEEVSRADAKEKINKVVEMDADKYFMNDMKSVINTYYNAEATSEDIAGIESECDGYIQSLTPPKAPAAPVLSKTSYNSITLAVAAKRIQYRLGEDGEWTSMNIFEGLEPNTEYKFYARVMPMNPTPASEPSEALVVKTDKVQIEGGVYIDGTAAYGNTLEARAELSYKQHGEIKYEWYRLGTIASDVKVGTGAEYTIAAEDIGCALYVVATAENCEGKLTSDPTAEIAKGTPEITKTPDVAVLFIGAPLSEAAITGAEVSVEGEWSWKNPEVIPDVSQSGTSFTAVFTPADADLYDAVEVQVVVTISTDTVTGTITDEKSGISLTGDFLEDAENPKLEVNDILPTDTAYLALLRAAKEADNALVLLKNLNISSNMPAAYIGTLTLRAYLGKGMANRTFTVFAFADGEVRSFEAQADANGYIEIEGFTVSCSANLMK